MCVQSSFSINCGTQSLWLCFTWTFMTYINTVLFTYWPFKFAICEMCKIRESLTICRSKNQPLGGRDFFILFNFQKGGFHHQHLVDDKYCTTKNFRPCPHEKDFIYWMFWLCYWSWGNSDHHCFMILELLCSSPCFSSTLSYPCYIVYF